MGQQQRKAVTGVDQVTPSLVDGASPDGGARLMGEFMFERLRESIMGEKVFQTIFGGGNDKADPLQSNIYLNSMPSYNDTILPAWEFRFSQETVQGADLRQTGRVRSRVLFPNNLKGELNFHRKVAMAIARYFNSALRIDDFLKKVPGLTEFGENLEFQYDLLFVHGGQQVPVITIGIDYIFDIRRFRLENPCTDLDDRLDAELIEEAVYMLEISGDDEVTGETEILIPESEI